MITEPPIPWGPLPNPFTLAGDESWRDYTVSADVHFLSQASAALIGRIDSSDVFRDDRAKWPAGYVLRLEPGGGWELLSTEYNKPEVTLACGNVTIDHARWHHIELRFHGTRIEANLDGSRLTAVDNAAHAHGMFALGTDWNRIQFDNLRVTQ